MSPGSRGTPVIAQIRASAARLVRRAAEFLDVTAHHVFAEIIVDDVAAVRLDEFRGLFRTLFVHERVFLQPGCNGVCVNIAIEVTPGSFIRCISQFLHQILDLSKIPHPATGRFPQPARALSSQTPTAPIR